MTELWKRYKSRVHANCIGDQTPSSEIDFWRNKLFYTIILYLPLLAMILLIPSMIMTYFMNLVGLAVAYFIFAATILFIATFRNINIKIRKYFFLGLLYLVAISLIFFMGHHGAGITYLFGVTVFTLLILPVKTGKITVIINFLLCCIHAFLIYKGIAEYPLRENYQVISWFLISGNSILLSIMAVIFIPMLFGGLQNTIKEQFQLEKELKSSLNDKETLLAEIHHRVKNNLAVVSGMLLLQSYKESDEYISNKLMDSTMRIKSMAGIHEQLYQSHNFSNMAFDTGLRNLVSSIFETMDNGNTIETIFNLESIQLNLNQAIPCSLIVNEVLTNSIKHAFKNVDRGVITLNLNKYDGFLSLQIMDNGIGFPTDYKSTEQNSLGMELIDSLATQLEATYTYESRASEPGTMFAIDFELSGSSESNGA